MDIGGAQVEILMAVVIVMVMMMAVAVMLMMVVMPMAVVMVAVIILEQPGTGEIHQQPHQRDSRRSRGTMVQRALE